MRAVKLKKDVYCKAMNIWLDRKGTYPIVNDYSLENYIIVDVLGYNVIIQRTDVLKEVDVE